MQVTSPPNFENRLLFKVSKSLQLKMIYKKLGKIYEHFKYFVPKSTPSLNNIIIDH